MKKIKNKKIKLGISIGDLNGIGGEIALRTFEDERMLDFCTPIFFASAKTISFLLKHFDIDIKFQGIKTAAEALEGKVNIVNIFDDKAQIDFGVETKESGKYAIQSLKSAVKSLKMGEIDVLVTAPINKSNIQDDDFKFPGHTDYLNQELEGDSLMFMITESLKIGLLTDHVPVKDVAEKITVDLINKKYKTIYNTLLKDFGVEKPKIAFLGINPHVGDGGVIGQEDKEILIPTLEKIREKGDLAYGPYAADSFFGSGNYKNFDAIIAAYHDQGLIPFKTLSFGKGVNFTAGLDKIRTSPDHGTAFEIAGKGVADHNSFKEAVYTAISIFKKRKEFKKLTKDVLQKQKRRPASSRRGRFE
ncbi:4-hydroxythreonine-4-phosphate dehydrogenase PdxA [Flavimarina sp. Hel_I_48]|uniref:4-hydroxythreonine-4-phosphate dehydrogenase PdxA n=1 Tax=Flavimarina sp. Hel_I_48 TaxID=1392488 RepID=UPI0004DEF5DA|nr:4-hydroxythreonine-4-phosphate dehydrogenase PdxA [Flavimarina sp. Hel_I_48]